MTRTPSGPSDPSRRPGQSRRSRLLWSVLLTLAAAAVVINVVVIDSPQVGFLVPVFVAVWIAMSSGGRPGACARRQAK